MKKIISLFIVFTLASCQVKNEVEKGPLEGVWERTGTLVFENKLIVDTLPLSDDRFQTKIFTKSHTIWLGNYKTLTHSEMTKTPEAEFIQDYTPLKMEF